MTLVELLLIGFQLLVLLTFVIPFVVSILHVIWIISLEIIFRGKE